MKKIAMNFTVLFIFFLYLPYSFAQDFPPLPEGATARLGKGIIEEIAYSPDGSRLAVSGSIGIWVYDANTGAEVALLTGHTGGVNSVAFSPDGNTIASGSGDGTVLLWAVSVDNLTRPDLAVASVQVDKNTVSPGESFTLSATVRNFGTAVSPGTTLRYYRSDDNTISTSDVLVETNDVPTLGLPPSGWSEEEISITLPAPSTPNIYYYGACVDIVADESNVSNNCSTAVEVTVIGDTNDDHGDTPSEATDLSLDGSQTGRIDPAGDVDYFRMQVNSPGELTVYTTGDLDTVGTLEDSAGTQLKSGDQEGDGSNFSIVYNVSAGTYYIRVGGYQDNLIGDYTLHASFVPDAGPGPGPGPISDLNGYTSDATLIHPASNYGQGLSSHITGIAYISADTIASTNKRGHEVYLWQRSIGEEWQVSTTLPMRADLFTPHVTHLIYNPNNKTLVGIDLDGGKYVLYRRQTGNSWTEVQKLSVEFKTKSLVQSFNGTLLAVGGEKRSSLLKRRPDSSV